MNWATNIRSKIEQDAHQPLNILEDLVEDGCNFVDDFLSRFNSTQLAPTTELVKTPSRRQNSTRRTRAAIAAAQKSAKKIQQINEDVFNEEPENTEQTEQPELPSKSPNRAHNSPSRLPLYTNQTAKKSVKLPENTTEKAHKSPPPAVNTFHKALLDMRDDKNADVGNNKQDKQEEDEPEEILDEPQEELAEPEEKQSPVQPEGSARKQKPSTDFTAPIRGDEDEEDTIKSKNNSPPRKSLAFASLPRRSPLKKSISTAKEPKESMTRASWLSQSVKGGPNVSESERSSSKRKSDRIEDETSEHTQSRKFNKSSSYEQQVNEPKTPADALALKTAEIRKRLTQVAGTQRKVNLFDLPPKEAPISLASEPIVQPSEQQPQEQASSVNAQLGDSTTPPNSPPKKRVEKSWGSGVSAHIPGAYPASDSGQQEQDQEQDQEHEEPEQEEQEEAPMQTEFEPEPYPEPTEDKEHEDEDAVERSILDVHKESRDEPMDLSEITQQQRKQEEERQKAESEDKMKNKRKHTNQDNMDEDGNEADEDDQTRPAKQPNTKQQPQPKPSLTVKPLQTANKFRPRAGSTDSDKKVRYRVILELFC
ncbi:hypothetical protein E3Q16_00799 [Wallemia mellicola]|uniref:Inner centromere protein ARK-binding domain-containing protein n=1 Tax=Wallemia mellicola TaxID=1708541 RepID=A0AB74KJX6_9BASI|nr:hypothetical protein E3Q24_00191 [Wallemia mellicola]TIB89141.1 hypothetical protein E3Q21_00716 [Wallemia mellicola]TIB91609.1 hypothetical protein E3Q20_00702 [Wallemia mellicola]TIC06938.1 hypothetical protein E3Q16_00799 [Wallemia mellicola]TIC26787.1 hypothetical protein E3Q12_00101 [Wallemia mellicola]